MANEVQRKYRSTITAQASAAITADTDSTGTQTVIDNSPAGNSAGCDEIQLTLDVTVVPTADAQAEIYMSTSDDGTNYAEYVLIKTIDVSSAATSDYQAGKVFYPRQYTKFKIKAIDYGFTASLNATPVLPEVQ